MPTREEILSKVQGVLSDALGVDEEEAAPDARLIDDLGAESIDILDIVFRLEKVFGVRIPRGEFLPERTFFDDPEFVDFRKEPHSITPRGIERLQQLLLWANVQGILGPTPLLQDIRKLVTVQYVCDFIDWKVNGAAARVTP